MRDNPEGGELDPVDDNCSRCKPKNASILSCIDKGRYRGSEVGTIHSGKARKGHFL